MLSLLVYFFSFGIDVMHLDVLPHLFIPASRLCMPCEFTSHAQFLFCHPQTEQYNVSHNEKDNDGANENADDVSRHYPA